MKIFKVNDDISIVCRSEKTRYGFRHLATLMYKGWEQGHAKLCYYNRTWERYEFQSVLLEMARKAQLSATERQLIHDFAEQYQENDSTFGILATVAALGDVLCNSKEEKNDWKTRMLKAGLEGKGLDMPEDWDTLSEDEKEKRLNKAIGELGQVSNA